MKSINLCPSQFSIFGLQVLHYNDFSRVTSDAESHWSFCEISPNFGFHNNVPINLRFGYKPRPNQAAQLVVLFEVYGGDFNTNGTRLIELNTAQDLEDTLTNLVQPIFPTSHYQVLADEARIIFDAMLKDITSHEIDFKDWLVSMEGIGGKSFNFKHYNKPDELYYAQVSASHPELNLLLLDAIAMVEINTDIKYPFRLQKLETIYKINNAPAVGSYLSTEISDLLFDLHRNTLVSQD